jgi:hypothetical protein
MVWSIDYVPICLSLEQVAMRAGNEVWMEISNNSALIVGDPQLILGQQLRPRLIIL